MPATFPIPTQLVIPGQLIASSLWNGEFQNIYNGFTPAGVDTYSSTDAQMQIQTNPYPGSVTSHATSLGGELERIRYQIAAMTGNTYWYQPPPATLSTVQNTQIPIGGLIEYPTNNYPNVNFLLANGQAVLRSSYTALLALLTFTTTGNLDGTTAVITNVASTNGMYVGQAIEGTGIPTGATILTIGTNTITISANTIALETGGTLTMYLFGNGDGSTTFNLPNYTDRFSVGAGNLYEAGQTGGAASVSVSLTDPGHNHTQNSHTHADAGHTHSTPNHTHTLANNSTSSISNQLAGPFIQADGSNNLRTINSGGTTQNTVTNTTSSGGGSTTGSGSASLNSATATNQSNTTGISGTAATLPPYLAIYKFMRVI